MKSKIEKILIVTCVYMFVILFSFFYDLAVLKHYNAMPEEYNPRIRLTTILFVGLLAGLTGGFIQVNFLERWLRNNPYWKSLLYIFLAYTGVFLFVATLGGIIYSTRSFSHAPFSSETLSYIVKQMGSPEYLKNYSLA